MSKSVTKNNMSNDFSKPVNAQILPPIKKSILKNMNVLALGMYKLNTKLTQTRTSQLPHDSRKSNKHVSFTTGAIPTTSVSRPKLKSNPMKDRVLLNNSQGKKPEVEDHHRNVKFSKNKTSVTACNDSLNAKTLNVNFVCATCGKCVLNDKHDMCVLKYVAKPLRKTVSSESNQKPRNLTRKLYERISSRVTDLYLITLQDKNSHNPICLMAKVTSSQAWLWHRRLSYLNFDTINLLSKNNIVEKGDACIFVGYSTQSRAYRVCNKRTRVIVETIHVNFNELPHMASDHVSSDPVPECPTTALEHVSLSPGPQ
nr:integrase, catalytic region, zinc finger, CCHC-type, peptidase aspartic, catalytic [Tanacetum cinerariifolium]